MKDDFKETIDILSRNFDDKSTREKMYLLMKTWLKEHKKPSLNRQLTILDQ